MNKEKVLKYFTVLPIMIIGYLVFKQFLYYNEIDKNKSFTTGKVIKYTEDIRSYGVYYEYIIKKKKYLENYTLEGVNEILYNCWETETNIKTGKIGMESGVERLITFISSKNNKK